MLGRGRGVSGGTWWQGAHPSSPLRAPRTAPEPDPCIEAERSLKRSIAQTPAVIERPPGDRSPPLGARATQGLGGSVFTPRVCRAFLWAPGPGAAGFARAPLRWAVRPVCDRRVGRKAHIAGLLYCALWRRPAFSRHSSPWHGACYREFVGDHGGLRHGSCGRDQRYHFA